MEEKKVLYQISLTVVEGGTVRMEGSCDYEILGLKCKATQKTEGNVNEVATKIMDLVDAVSSKKDSDGITAIARLWGLDETVIKRACGLVDKVNTGWVDETLGDILNKGKKGKGKDKTEDDL